MESLISFTEKLQALLQQDARLKKETAQLTQDLAASQATVEAQRQRIAELEQRLAIVQYAAGELSDIEKKAFEKKLNGYIRQIDKVITHLSQ